MSQIALLIFHPDAEKGSMSTDIEVEAEVTLYPLI